MVSGRAERLGARMLVELDRSPKAGKYLNQNVLRAEICLWQ